MSHVFISYSRSDKDKLDNIVQWLKANGFQEQGDERDIWWDSSGIEGGENWRDEIDTAIDDSFAMLVLLTPNSLQSHFVTYEWTRALANEIKVIPLIINESDLPSGFKNPLYESKQNIQWNDESNRENLIQRLRELKKESPLSFFLGLSIYDFTCSMRVLTLVTLWSYQFIPQGIVTEEEFRDLCRRAKEAVYNCKTHKMREFWLTHSSAFNRRQKRTYAELVDKTDHLWDLLVNIDYQTQFPFNDLRYKSWMAFINETAGYFEEVLAPLFQALRATYDPYREFKSYLLDIARPDLTQTQVNDNWILRGPYIYSALETLDIESAALIKEITDKVMKAHLGNSLNGDAGND